MARVVLLEGDELIVRREILVSGKGKVTLNEAYQFAFGETLGRTVESRGGPQHPSYDINLSGTGDVVITDMRQTTASIVLGEALEGRIFIRNAKQELVVELYKPAGRKVELGLEPGEPLLRCDQQTEDEHGRPIELCEMVYRGDRYRFRATLVRGS